MIRVYADMVGDLFHYGHVRFLERARTLGDQLSASTPTRRSRTTSANR